MGFFMGAPHWISWGYHGDMMHLPEGASDWGWFYGLP